MVDEADLDELKDEITAMRDELTTSLDDLERYDAQILETLSVVASALRRHIGPGQDPELEEIFEADDSAPTLPVP